MTLSWRVEGLYVGYGWCKKGVQYEFTGDMNFEGEVHGKKAVEALD